MGVHFHAERESDVSPQEADGASLRAQTGTAKYRTRQGGADKPATGEAANWDSDSEPSATVARRGRCRHPARELFQSDYVKKLLRYHFLAVAILPTLGSMVALVLALREGVGMLEIVSLLVAYTLTFVGVEVGFHRYFAHRSFQATTALRLGLAVLGSMAAQGPLVYWTSVHRHHHAFSDQDGDIHSPHHFGRGALAAFRGIFHAHMGWMFEHAIPNAGYYVPDLLQDRLIRKVNQHYYACILLGLAIPALIGWALTGTWMGALKGFLWGGLLRIFLVDHMTWSVNSICHVFGKRRFATRDGSRNNLWLSIPTFGQSWHNNHHAFPWSARVGLVWREVDLGSLAIRLFQLLRLASRLKEPSAEMIAARERELVSS